MSKDNLKTKQLESYDDEEKYGMQQKLWNYPDSSATQSRTCCSPVDEIEEMGNEEKSSSTQSVEVQTEKSALFLLKQDKKFDNCKKSNVQNSDSKESLEQPNEFQNIKLRKTEVNYEQEKIPAQFSVNINTQVLDEYAETESDQPMDYALRYNETNLEEEKKETIQKNEFLCYEETIEEEKIETIKPKGAFSKEVSRNKKDIFISSRSFKEIFSFFKDRDKKRSNENSKASTSEGSKIAKTSDNYEQKVEKSPQSTRSSIEPCEKESKTKSETQCAQQTPLIFSRCSSLGSLSGFEQNSVQDDRSSIISDVSHRTSGVISPSELPDSPAQTAPAGFKLQQKCPIGFFGKKKIQIPQQEKPKVCQPPTISNENAYLQTESNLKKLPVMKNSVFEDYLTSFKDESTPTKLHSMAASSLSSLTIDDDDDFELINKNNLSKEKQNISEENKIQNNRQDPVGKSNDKTNSTIKLEKTEIISQEEEGIEEEENDQLTNLTPYEEQLLDECIRRGIAKWTKQNINEIKPFSWDVGLTCLATKALLANKIRIKSIDILKEIVEKQNILQNNSILDDNNTNNNNSNFENDSQNENMNNNNEVYSDEIYSTNNPSLNEKKSNNQLLENSHYVTYEEHLLDQCIRRGIAKITKQNINDIRPFSWDTNQICLTTRARMLHSFDDINAGICAT